MRMFFSGLKTALLLVSCLSVSTAKAAGPQTLTGVVRNLTIGRPSAGDDVVLLRLAQGLQQEARTKTDAHGLFSLNVTLANVHRIVRVLHQGVNYDQAVTGLAPLEINVFDAVTNARNVAGKFGIAQIESDGKMLKVTEMYALSNASSPAVTQAGSNNFLVSVPGNGALQWVEVKGPGSIWLKVVPVLAKGQENKYTINFPLRPGDTLFKFMFFLAYKGLATLQLKLAYPVQKFAVMHPSSMEFKPSAPGTFDSPGQSKGLQVEQTLAKTLISEVPSFEISGIAATPFPASAAKTAPPVAAPSIVASDSTESAHFAKSLPAAVQSEQKAWLILLAIIFILTIGISAALRMRREARSVAGRKHDGNQRLLLEALGQELSRLERARLQGAISTEEYAGTRQALYQGIRVATSRGRIE
jgi:hypothetical protein